MLASRRFALADVRRAPWDCPQGRGSSTIVSTTLIDACAIAGVGALSRKEEQNQMCDYSLHAVATRPAKVGETLITTTFRGTPTRGFASESEPTVAV